MRYVMERYREKMSEMAYRIYITDSIKAIGRLEGDRFYDINQMILDAGSNRKKEILNPEEESKKIISHIKMGLKNLSKS